MDRKSAPGQTYGYRKLSNSSRLYPLPPSAVFRCRPTTPWIIPEDFKELQIGSFSQEFHEGGAIPPQQAAIIASISSGNSGSSSDDNNSLDLNVLYMGDNIPEEGNRGQIGTTIIIDDDTARETFKSEKSAEYGRLSVSKSGRKMRISKPRVLPMSDNFLY
ncbi:uncharacterized protein LOC110856557 isoform X2 [Folsomia candida]|uniref:uncharacterized protein LOC110856557 isoform X2 n=1 Tax=Folsomia candida TaxID=158441 RepID=UPI001604AB1E|nr:uncharacterized protein LOC110856557 isoform X2 [Folsomia candida]